MECTLFFCLELEELNVTKEEDSENLRTNQPGDGQMKCTSFYLYMFQCYHDNKLRRKVPVSQPLLRNGSKRMSFAQVMGLVFGEAQQSDPGLTLEATQSHTRPQHLSGKRVQSHDFI